LDSYNQVFLSTKEVTLFPLFYKKKIRVMRNYILLFIVLTLGSTVFAQRDDIVLTKEKKEFAFNSIKELKDGAMVVRLKTNHRKIAIIERNLRSTTLTKGQRKRQAAILTATIKARDEFNDAIASMFLDSFTYCPVYVMYDTCSSALNKGVREGLFLGKEGKIDPSIKIDEAHIFIVNYKESGAEFPFDVLRVRKLKEKLEDPFPYYIALRESWVNQVNSPRASRAVQQLNRKLYSFYRRSLEYDKKMEERAARNAANNVVEPSKS
jgi:hypothetical protein